MIEIDDYLTGWKRRWPQARVPDGELTEDMRSDAYETVERTNRLLTAFGEERAITSGWRPLSVNRLIPSAAKHSKHMLCQAIDLADPDGDLDEWCMEHQHILDQVGLWMEHPAATKGWTHLQTRQPKSQKRVFYP